MHTIDLDAILGAIPRVRIGIVGDFCLDAYWEIDPAGSEESVETGLPTRAVRSQRYSLGGAGNVAQNLRAMGVAQVAVFGATGDDPFAFQMRRLMADLALDATGLLCQADGFTTHAYIKPLADGVESNRIDFGNFNRLSPVSATALARALAAALPHLDLVVINQQVPDGIHASVAFQAALQELITAHPGTPFVLDSRDYSERYAGTLRKMNAYEALRLTGSAVEPRDTIGLADARAAAQRLAAAYQRPFFLSRGERGCLVVDGPRLDLVPGLHIVEPTDPTGAGDSLLAGIAAALATGATPLDAAIFGNFVAGVTVQKCRQTGTASPAEIRAIGSSPDYVFRPERADDPRQARFLSGTEIECITDVTPGSHRVAHAIFDHDGTISVLREGWEKIMEPMMLHAILGTHYATADETTFHRVQDRVRDYIDSTTGVQTLVQMQGLVRLVREFGCVPAADIKDASGYKAIYNDALLERVHQRLAKLRRGELQVADFVITGVLDFLQHLHHHGVTLYLASGTDEADVLAEAEALGYAHLFGGRIYGAVGDVTKEAKKMVMDRILADIGPDQVGALAAFGDGPVEIRECHKRGGLAVGVASDEVRRFGANPAKRRRLVRAGADLLIADFTQWQQLLPLLGLPPPHPA